MTSQLPSTLQTLFKYALLCSSKYSYRIIEYIYIISHILIYIFITKNILNLDFLILRLFNVLSTYSNNFLVLPFLIFFWVFYRYIDEHKQEYINNLGEAIAIKSVSAWADHRDQIVKMMKWAEVKLKNLGVTTELADIGKQLLPDGSEIPLPPVLLGTLGSDPKKKTVLLYGHLDVQPALKEDGWDTDPFTLVEKDGKLFGRGSTDDKGPVLCWLHALEAYKANGIDIPVNTKVSFNDNK